MKNLLIGILLVIFCIDSFSQKMIQIRGVITNIDNPCTTSPCLPGVVLGVHTDTIDYVLMDSNHWITNDSLIINDYHLHSGDSIKASGIDCIKLDINKKEYHEFSLTQFVTSINEDNLFSIKLYPNPVVGNLIVDLNQELMKQIYIVDFAGRLVYKISNINSNSTTIDMTDISRGIYFINILIDEKREIIRKIIK